MSSCVFTQVLNKLLKEYPEQENISGFGDGSYKFPCPLFYYHQTRISLAPRTAPHAKTEDKGINMTSFITPVKF